MLEKLQYPQHNLLPAETPTGTMSETFYGLGLEAYLSLHNPGGARCILQQNRSDESVSVWNRVGEYATETEVVRMRMQATMAYRLLVEQEGSEPVQFYLTRAVPHSQENRSALASLHPHSNGFLGLYRGVSGFLSSLVPSEMIMVWSSTRAQAGEYQPNDLVFGSNGLLYALNPDVGGGVPGNAMVNPTSTQGTPQSSWVLSSSTGTSVTVVTMTGSLPAVDSLPGDLPDGSDLGVNSLQIRLYPGATIYYLREIGGWTEAGRVQSGLTQEQIDAIQPLPGDLINTFALDQALTALEEELRGVINNLDLSGTGSGITQTQLDDAINTAVLALRGNAGASVTLGELLGLIQAIDAGDGLTQAEVNATVNDAVSTLQSADSALDARVSTAETAITVLEQPTALQSSFTATAGQVAAGSGTAAAFPAATNVAAGLMTAADRQQLSDFAARIAALESQGDTVSIAWNDTQGPDIGGTVANVADGVQVTVTLPGGSTQTTAAASGAFTLTVDGAIGAGSLSASVPDGLGGTASTSPATYSPAVVAGGPPMQFLLLQTHIDTGGFDLTQVPQNGSTVLLRIEEAGDAPFGPGPETDGFTMSGSRVSFGSRLLSALIPGDHFRATWDGVPF